MNEGSFKLYENNMNSVLDKEINEGSLLDQLPFLKKTIDNEIENIEFKIEILMNKISINHDKSVLYYILPEKAIKFKRYQLNGVFEEKEKEINSKEIKNVKEKKNLPKAKFNNEEEIVKKLDYFNLENDETTSENINIFYNKDVTDNIYKNEINFVPDIKDNYYARGKEVSKNNLINIGNLKFNNDKIVKTDNKNVNFLLESFKLKPDSEFLENRHKIKASTQKYPISGKMVPIIENSNSDKKIAINKKNKYSTTIMSLESINLNKKNTKSLLNTQYISNSSLENNEYRYNLNLKDKNYFNKINLTKKEIKLYQYLNDNNVNKRTRNDNQEYIKTFQTNFTGTSANTIMKNNSNNIESEKTSPYKITTKTKENFSTIENTDLLTHNTMNKFTETTFPKINSSLNNGNNTIDINKNNFNLKKFINPNVSKKAANILIQELNNVNDDSFSDTKEDEQNQVEEFDKKLIYDDLKNEKISVNLLQFKALQEKEKNDNELKLKNNLFKEEKLKSLLESQLSNQLNIDKKLIHISNKMNIQNTLLFELQVENDISKNAIENSIKEIEKIELNINSLTNQARKKTFKVNQSLKHTNTAIKHVTSDKLNFKQQDSNNSEEEDELSKEFNRMKKYVTFKELNELKLKTLDQEFKLTKFLKDSYKIDLNNYIALNDKISSDIEDTKKSIVLHYHQLLIKGKDTRQKGLSWIILEIWKLGANVFMSHLPSFCDKKLTEYLFIKAHLEVELIKSKNLLIKMKNMVQTLRGIEFRKNNFDKRKKFSNKDVSFYNYIDNFRCKIYKGKI